MSQECRTNGCCTLKRVTVQRLDGYAAPTRLDTFCGYKHAEESSQVHDTITRGRIDASEQQQELWRISCHRQCCSRTSLSSRKLSPISVMCSACRVSPVTAESRREICRTTSGARPRENFAIRAIRRQRTQLSRRHCIQQSAARRGAQVSNATRRGVRGGATRRMKCSLLVDQEARGVRR